MMLETLGLFNRCGIFADKGEEREREREIMQTGRKREILMTSLSLC